MQQPKPYDQPPAPRAAAARRLAARLALYALIWWILSGGDAASWLWGAPAILLAALLLPGAGLGGWRALGLLRFLPLFLWLSLRSAVDIAWRAVQPRPPLTPALLSYPWRLPPSPARLFLASLINLIPGTLSIELGERALTVHVLTNSPATVRYIERLEVRVAGLFGLPLEPS